MRFSSLIYVKTLIKKKIPTQTMFIWGKQSFMQGSVFSTVFRKAVSENGLSYFIRVKLAPPPGYLTSSPRKDWHSRKTWDSILASAGSPWAGEFTSPSFHLIICQGAMTISTK